MTGVASFFRRLFKSRKHKRFKVLEGSLVVVGRDPEHGPKIQIVDISEGGLAFIYSGSKADLEEEGVLNLLSYNDVQVSKVAFETASDVEIGQYDNNNEPLRRRGVQFKWLGVLEKAQIDDFIKANSAD